MTKFHGPNIAGKTMFWMSENKQAIYRAREHCGNSAHRPVSQHQPSNGQQCSTKTKHQHLSVQLESINHKELYAQSLVPVYVQQWEGNTGLSLDHQAACTLAAILLLARGASAVKHDDVSDADLLRVVDDVLVVLHQGSLALILHGLELTQRHHGTCKTFHSHRS